jgi:hypothetical protein
LRALDRFHLQTHNLLPVLTAKKTSNTRRFTAKTSPRKNAPAA